MQTYRTERDDADRQHRDDERTEDKQTDIQTQHREEKMGVLETVDRPTDTVYRHTTHSKKDDADCRRGRHTEHSETRQTDSTHTEKTY